MSIQSTLRRDGRVLFEGRWLTYLGEWVDLRPGDTYVAERNSGPKLLTVREVRKTLGEHDEYAGAVFAVEPAYPFDLWECVKVAIEAES